MDHVDDDDYNHEDDCDDGYDCDDAVQVEKIERSMPVAASNRLSNREHLGKAKTAGCCYQ